MIEGLIGRKLGMIQMFDKDGSLRGVTVIEAGPCLITQIRTQDRDGYEAVQLGFGATKRRNKPMRGHLKQQGNLRFLREFKVEESSSHAIGERVGAEIFEEGDRVDVTGVSKGRGFAGVVKRHHFAGGPKTHGQSDRHRAPGSIGSGNTPGRVFKGMRMGGHMGDEKVTVQGLEVLQSDPVRGLLLVAGSVPGAKNGLLRIRYASQTLKTARTRTPKTLEEIQAEATAADEAAPVGTDEAAAESDETAAEAPVAEAPADDATADDKPAESANDAPTAADEAGEGKADAGDTPDADAAPTTDGEQKDKS